jgi:hypothetical protein
MRAVPDIRDRKVVLRGLVARLDRASWKRFDVGYRWRPVLRVPNQRVERFHGVHERPRLGRVPACSCHVRQYGCAERDTDAERHRLGELSIVA